MVLAEVATAIHGFFWTLYKFLQISVVVGQLLFQGICWTISVVHFCSQSLSSFFSVVYVDNRYLLEDARAMIVGLPELIYENIHAVYNFYCRLATSIQRTLDIVQNLPVLVVDMAKQSVVLFGEAVWMLATLPGKLLFAILLDVQDGCIDAYRKLAAFGYYLVMDVPLEAAGGLSLAAFAYCYPSIPKRLASLVILLVQLSTRRVSRLWNQLAFTATCRTIGTNCRIHIIRGRSILSRSATTIYDREIQPFIQNVARFFILRSTHQSTDERSVSQPAPLPSTSPKRLEGLKMDNCILCEDNLRSVAFVPCGHFCACLRCAINLSNYDSSCPLCRTRIERNLNIYIG
ncbi:hypothetical protein AND_010215 [Anopheles darlingi]|uniref:RING-type domain-containing protein n=1 Tax=Anopheles darlingi TaxID=43151 RepID=W5J312_ANODA|nr:hypothetical protein AND_010215 [Anopheles darlingi]